MPLYTFEQARRELLDRLGGRSTARDQERAEQWLNSAILKVALTDLDLPPLDRTVTGALVPDASEYSLSSIHPALADIIGIRQVRLGGMTPRRLVRMSWVEWREITTQGRGAPIRWARHGTTFAVDPRPETSYTLTIDYRAKPRPGILDLPDSWHDVVLDLATHLGWSALGDSTMADSYFNRLPGAIGLRLSSPLDESHWEAIWDEELRLEPRQI